MKKMILMTALLCSMGCLGYAHESNESLGGVSWNPKVADYIQFECNDMGIALQLPRIELNHRMQQISLSNFEKSEVVNTLRNGGSEFTFKGQVNGLDNVFLMMKLRTYPGSKILRFQYAFADKRQNYCMTKSDGHDAISYLSVACPQETQIREIRLSEYNDMIHATHLTGYDVSPSAFETDGSVMGPILTMTGRRHSFLIAYEHGSQYPDRFFGYSFLPNHSIELRAQKGNYMDGDKLDGFKTVWFEISAVAGDENMLSDEYRKFVLDDLSESGASRLPYLYYNTWGRQERVKWSGGSYLQSMNLETILSEIDRAHELGMDYYVIDTGWFEKTGDWRVSTTRFPDNLKKIKERLDKYNMKLGLWFNPCAAALSSKLLARNTQNEVTVNGQKGKPYEVWETEQSVNLCLVSSYWEDFANQLIRLVKETGVSYFKFDGVGQYGCSSPNHYHGGKKYSEKDRMDRYAFLQPLYLTLIAEKVTKACPDAIFDLDITEDGRCVGLQFLTVGKYFIMNNGPYYHNFDLAPTWKSVLPNGNCNVFTNPGAARGWFTRSVLDYEPWLPSILFLTHYQMDGSRNSQIINAASLILGQNGIWGEILKISPDDVGYVGAIMDKYKSVRQDMTDAPLHRIGIPGGNPEIYEKINRHTGKGAVVIFANSKGKYEYTVDGTDLSPQIWHTEGVTIQKKNAHLYKIETTFMEPSAKIIFFGTN